MPILKPDLHGFWVMLVFAVSLAALKALGSNAFGQFPLRRTFYCDACGADYEISRRCDEDN